MKPAIGFIFGTFFGAGIGFFLRIKCAGKVLNDIPVRTSDQPDFNARVEKHNDANNENTEKEPLKDISDDSSPIGPVVISPEEFGEEPDYEKRTFTLWSDGVVTDEQDIPLDDISLIGKDSLNHFGEYENDAVQVRNDETREYYEILVDYRPYRGTVKDDE